MKVNYTTPDVIGQDGKILRANSSLEWAVVSGNIDGYSASIIKRRAVYYTAGLYMSCVISNASITAESLIALPILAPEWDANITGLRFSLWSGGGSGRNVRLGVYRNTGDDTLYPNNLVYDSGDISTLLAGIKEVTPTVSCVARELLWITFFNSHAQTFASVASNSGSSILGYESFSAGNAATYGHRVSTTFGALPDPYPTVGRVAATGNLPALFVRFEDA